MRLSVFLFVCGVLFGPWGTFVRTTTGSPYAPLRPSRNSPAQRKNGRQSGAAAGSAAKRHPKSTSSSSSSGGDVSGVGGGGGDETIARALAVPLSALEDSDVYMQPVFRRAFELLEVDLEWQCHTNSSTEMFDLFDSSSSGHRDGVLAGQELQYLSEYFDSGSVPMELFDKDHDGKISKSEFVHRCLPVTVTRVCSVFVCVCVLCHHQSELFCHSTAFPNACFP